eukprot:4762225-Alexandrium_andersonii.AAC.1
MSASLVGSEMCIRDRDRRYPNDPSTASSRARPRCSNSPRGGLDAMHPPVSYTHLTLPTICSV